MNTKLKYFIILLIVIALFSVFFVRTYYISPGYVTQESADEFYRTAESCLGISIDISSKQIADAPEKSICIGVLK